MAIPEATGKNVAAVAVFEVISVSTKIPIAASATRTQTETPASPSTCSPSHSDRPESENCADKASPPPNSNNTPQGRLSAVSQFNRRTPWYAPPGIINSATPTARAIPASENTGSSSQNTYSEIRETSTQEMAETINTMSTENSPTDIGPRLLHSFRIRSEPPRIRFISGLNMIFVKMNQAPTIKTMDIGMPTSIHRPNPRFISC